MRMFRFLARGAPAPRLTDEAEVDRRFQTYRWWVLATLCLGYGSAYTCRLGLSVIRTETIEAGVFTATALGSIGLGFKWAYGFGKLFNGTLADFTNVKRFWALGLAISAVVNLFMGTTTVVPLAIAFWALNGWFQGFLAPASAIGITQWFSNKARGRAYGVWSASHSLGEGLTFVGTSSVVALLGWRFAYFGPGVYCLVVAAFALWALRDHPTTYGLPPVNEWATAKEVAAGGPSASAGVEEAAPEREGFEEELAEVSGEHAASDGTTVAKRSLIPMEVLVDPRMWVIGTASALMYISRYAVTDWGMLYLEKEQGFNKAEAGIFLGVNAVLGLLGSPIYGWVSDKLFAARRPPATLVFGLMEIGGMLLMFYAPKGETWMLLVGLGLYGFSLSGLIAVLGGLFAVDIAPKYLAGAAMGFVGCFSYLGAGLQEIVSGLLIDQGTTRLDDGSVVIDFSVPILFWIGCSVLSAALGASLWRVEVRD